MVLGLVWGHPLHMFLLCSRMALLTRTRALLWTFLLLHSDVIHIHVNTQPQGLPSNNDEVEHINLERMVLPGDMEDMQCMLSNTLCKQDNTTNTVFFEPKKSIHLSLSSYQLTTLFSFRPYLNAIEKLAQYMNKLEEDIDNNQVRAGQNKQTVGNYLMLKIPQKSTAPGMEKALLNEIKAKLKDTIDVIKNPEDITGL